MTEDVSTRIRSLDERLARLRQERGRLVARASQADRRRDTRQKILVENPARLYDFEDSDAIVTGSVPRQPAMAK